MSIGRVWSVTIWLESVKCDFWESMECDFWENIVCDSWERI